jgi:hypothetical protein
MAHPRSWFLRVLLLALLLSSSGCALWFQQTHPPVRRTMEVAMSPDVAFLHALRVVNALGCTLWFQDRHTRTLQAYLHTATQLTVTVTPKRKGSELVVVHQNLPTYFGMGNDGMLSEQFLAHYTQTLEAKQP